jgi:glutamate---cysteine ligase / carboxylate-amine ligase
MPTRYTLGIEEELQIVDCYTGQLHPCIETILEKGTPIFGEQLKSEQHQCMVELVSDILPDIPTARQEMRALRAKLAQMLQTEGLALISAGTHHQLRERKPAFSNLSST